MTSASGLPAKITEVEYLEREADEASRAAGQTMSHLKETLKGVADIKSWLREYPWSSLGAAAAAGLLVATALVPKKRKRSEEDAALLQRILTDERIAARLRELVSQDRKGQQSASVAHSVVMTLVKTLGPAIQQAVTAAIAAKAAQMTEPTHPDAPTADGQPTGDVPRHDPPPGDSHAPLE